MKVFILGLFCVCSYALTFERLPTKCEGENLSSVCKLLSVEVQKALDQFGHSNEVGEIESNISETMYVEAVQNACERVPPYYVCVERPDGLRCDEIHCQAMRAVRGLINRGVKVNLGIPCKQWDQSSVVLNIMKIQCETMVVEFEQVLFDWFFHHQDQRLEIFLCENHVLESSERDCLNEAWKGDMGSKQDDNENTEEFHYEL